LFIFNSSQVRTYLKQGGSFKGYQAAVTDNAWHHLTWMRDGSIEVLALDGVSLGVNTVTGDPIDIAPGGGDGLWLGSEQDSVGGGWQSNQEFEGTMDEVIFYDRALSESEIADIIEAERSCN
jgi:hypothetical protein